VSLNVATPLSPPVNISYSHEYQRYNIASTHGGLEKTAAVGGVSVKFLPNDGLLVVRRGLGGPAAVVAG